MAILTFESLRFFELKNEEKLRVTLFGIFYFDVPLSEVNSIGHFKITKKDRTHDSLEFDVSEKRASSKFSNLITKYISTLTNSVNGKKAVYIHQNSGIPLLGNGSFGIVDRGSNLIEIKPITSCNIDCIYCSINEPIRADDFVIEPDYLISELAVLIKEKQSEDIEIHIGCQGEPMLYEPLLYLIKELSKIKRIKRISMDTNAVMITEKKADELINAGLTQFNISINSLVAKQSKYIANNDAYDIDKIKAISLYIAKKSDVIIAPVIIPGVNDDELEDFVLFTKELITESKYSIRLGLQKFMNYSLGKNPVKEESWDSFTQKLKTLETKHNIKLILDSTDFHIKKDIELKKPFKKHEIVKAQIICVGRMARERIAVAQGRTISIADCDKMSGTIKVKILRTKHNIFFGIPA